MSSTLKKEYTNGDVTIVWKPELCIHSGVCRKGLPDVFDPGARPWVDANAATSHELTDQIDKCPSGALSWYKNADGAPKETEQTGVASTSIDILPNGPIRIRGQVTIKHSNGETEERETITSLCRCGLSAKKPYCDGAHNRAGWAE